MSAVVEVKDLVKRYKGADRSAVDGISFSVEEGRFFALLGPNGAGKTTTVSILTTTLLPTAGSVRIAGHDVVAEATEVRRQVGIIFQKPSLDANLSAEENVRFHAVLYGLYPFRPTFSLMPADYRRRILELADIVAIREELFQPIKTFSGGMKRKLEIVRGLIHQPRILFLDEPTTGLDVATRRTLWSYLREVRETQGTTIVVTTHYLEEAEQADDVVIIDRGVVAAAGSPNAIKAALAHDRLIIDAADRQALGKELRSLGVAFTGSEAGEPFVIPANGLESHRLLKRIETPLTMIRSESPTLEDAYLAIVARGAMDE